MPPTPTCRPLHRAKVTHARGFTLIELMVTVAIIGILAAIAMPSYRDYILRGQLVDATNLLSAGRANMERYFQDNRTYAKVSSTIFPPCDLLAGAPARTQGSFVLSCPTDPTASAYTLVATGSGSTAGFTFNVTQTDTRTSVVASPAQWPLGTYACWYTKRGAC